MVDVSGINVEPNEGANPFRAKTFMDYSNPSIMAQEMAMPDSWISKLNDNKRFAAHTEHARIKERQIHVRVAIQREEKATKEDIEKAQLKAKQESEKRYLEVEKDREEFREKIRTEYAGHLEKLDLFEAEKWVKDNIVKLSKEVERLSQEVSQNEEKCKEDLKASNEDFIDKLAQELGVDKSELAALQTKLDKIPTVGNSFDINDALMDSLPIPPAPPLDSTDAAANAEYQSKQREFNKNNEQRGKAYAGKQAAAQELQANFELCGVDKDPTMTGPRLLRKMQEKSKNGKSIQETIAAAKKNSKAPSAAVSTAQVTSTAKKNDAQSRLDIMKEQQAALEATKEQKSTMRPSGPG